MTSPKRWLLFALALHLVAACLSRGYYHSDEHFQILEFVGYKLGLTPVSALPVEFHRMLRPWLQPGLYFLITRVAHLFGSDNPFVWTLLMRIFSAVVGFISLALLLFSSRPLLRSEAAFRVAAVASATLWFMPAFHARLSSENLGGSCFFIAASLLFLRGARAGLAFTATLGILFGLSFEFRYQCAFMVLGLFAWLAAFPKASPWRDRRHLRLMILGLGASAAVLFSTLIDRWGYGAWTFAPLNYFRYNLIEGHVGDIDQHPLWDFFRTSLTETWPPLGLLLLLLLVVAWIRHPKNPLTWATFPLFAVHSLIGHKELRFLFPIIHAAPLFVALALDGWPLEILASPFAAWYWRLPARLVVLDNWIALVALTATPAWMPVLFYAEIYARARATLDQPFRLYYKDKNPYEVLGAPLYFYRPPGLELNSTPSFAGLSKLIQEEKGSVWFFYPAEPLPADSQLGLVCQPRSSTLPESVLRWNPAGLTSRMTNWVLYECAKI